MKTTSRRVLNIVFTFRTFLNMVSASRRSPQGLLKIPTTVSARELHPHLFGASVVTDSEATQNSRRISSFLVNGGPSSSLRQDPPAAWAGCRPAGAQMATRIGSSQHQGSDQTTPILLILDSKDLNLDSKDLNLDSKDLNLDL